MKIKYVVLRNKLGNYLATYQRVIGGVDWKVTPHPWNAKNFDSSPNELSTAIKFFKKSQWKVVSGTLTWTEK